MNQDKPMFTQTNLKKIEDDLQEFYDELFPLFKRREQRERTDTYLRGLLQPLPNKSVESMKMKFVECNTSSAKGVGMIRLC